MVTRSELNLLKEEVSSSGSGNGVNPMTLVLMKERLTPNSNPCIGCDLEYSEDSMALDFCHYQCKK